MTSPRIAALATTIVLLGATAETAQAQDADAQVDALASSVVAARDALSFSPARVSLAALAEALGESSAEGAALAIRDNFSFDPYEGVVRGGRGTLFSGGGNSLDRALLLTALLDEIGADWRIVRGTLSPAAASDLLSTATGSGSWAGPSVSRDASVYDPASDLRMRSSLQNHYWVEVRQGADWVAVDPTFPGLEFGETATAPEQQWPPNSVPDELLRTVTLTVNLETDAGSTQQVLSWQGSVADVGYRNISLHQRRDPVTNAIASRLVTPDGDLLGAPVNVAAASRVWIEIFVQGGGPEQRVVRDLLAPDSTFDFFAVDQQVFSIVLLPGFVGPDYFRAVVGAQLETLADELPRLGAALAGADDGSVSVNGLGEACDDAFALIAGTVSLAAAHFSDSLAIRLAAGLGVRPFYDHSRVIMTSVLRQGSQVGVRLDLRSDEINALPYAGVPATATYAFQALRGHVASTHEGEMVERLTGRSALDIGDVFDAAAEADAGLRTVHLGTVGRLAQTTYSVEAQRRLATLVTNDGNAAITTTRAATIGETALLGWWRVIPATASIQGTLEPDLHGGFTLFGFGEPVGNDAASLAREVVELLTAFVAFAADPTAPDGEGVCSSLCELGELAGGACGSSPTPTLSSCLAAPASSAVDLLAGERTCSDVLATFGCGVAAARSVLSGGTVVRLDSGSFGGPWGDVLPWASADCACD